MSSSAGRCDDGEHDEEEDTSDPLAWLSSGSEALTEGGPEMSGRTVKQLTGVRAGAEGLEPIIVGALFTGKSLDVRPLGVG